MCSHLGENLSKCCQQEARSKAKKNIYNMFSKKSYTSYISYTSHCYAKQKGRSCSKNQQHVR